MEQYALLTPEKETVMRLAVYAIGALLAVFIAAALLGVGDWHPLLRVVYAVVAGLVVVAALWKWGPK